MYNLFDDMWVYNDTNTQNIESVEDIIIVRTKYKIQKKQDTAIYR
jgi:hypothetical protein